MASGGVAAPVSGFIDKNASSVGVEKLPLVVKMAKCLETGETVAIKKVLQDKRFVEHLRIFTTVLEYVTGILNLRIYWYYRAPEHIFGANEYTTAIDIWSAGFFWFYHICIRTLTQDCHSRLSHGRLQSCCSFLAASTTLHDLDLVGLDNLCSSTSWYVSLFMLLIEIHDCSTVLGITCLESWFVAHLGLLFANMLSCIRPFEGIHNDHVKNQWNLHGRKSNLG
ncbi:hypothetical protein KIW84_015224 [Lathyrus oleraceus]|uniref:Uncharacterized protein n=1 Tax=Pisum sativum TaxID=3888 RepID=A0A9D5BQ11_PEA|nr:hypothetical protein KIW84_015224 [Pisum sativum]